MSSRFTHDERANRRGFLAARRPVGNQRRESVSRPRYRTGARAVEGHAESLADYWSRHNSLPTIAGIGEDLSQKIAQLIHGEEDSAAAGTGSQDPQRRLGDAARSRSGAE
jgi:hypothetical protein